MSSPDAPNFYNYRGAALRAPDYFTMLELEGILGKPVPHFYDEGEVGFWPDRNYEEAHDPYKESHPRPWRLYLLKYPWKAQLGPGSYAFVTRDGFVTGLSLFSVALSVVPAPVFRLAQLTRLLLTGNNFSTIPPEIERLTELTALAFGEDISALPDTMDRLRKLSFLDLSDSKLKELPQGLLDLPALARVVIDTRFPEGDPVLEGLRRKGTYIEVIFGYSYEPTRDEIAKWVLDFARAHPSCRWHEMHEMLTPRAYMIAEDVIDELESKGRITFRGG